MKNVIKKLIVAGLALTLSVTSLFAAETIKCYGVEYPSWADGPLTELVDQNTNGGTRTIKDVVVKNGVAFVNVDELSDAYGYLGYAGSNWIGLSLNCAQVVDTNKNFSLIFSYNYAAKTVESEYCYKAIDDKQPCISLRAETTTEDTWAVGSDGVTCYPTTKTVTYYYGTFTTTNKPFLQNGKMYVPAKLFITLINNDATTPVKYNADNNTITFEDRLCAPIYKCIGYWFRKDGKVTEYNLDGTVKSVTQVEQKYIQ